MANMDNEKIRSIHFIIKNKIINKKNVCLPLKLEEAETQHTEEVKQLGPLLKSYDR